MPQLASRLPHVSPARLVLLNCLLRLLQAVSPGLASRVAFRLFLRPMRRGLQPDDVAFMAGARSHVLQAGDDRVQAYEWGTGVRTVLIAHGWGSRGGRFSLLARALLERGWRVVTFDAPGHGLSAGSSSSLPQFIAALDAVATQLGPVHALIGHSLGALAIACQRSGAAPGWVSSLQKVVLISMPAGVPFLVESFERMFDISAATASHMQARFRTRFGTEPAFLVANREAAPLQLATLLVHDRGDDIAHTHTVSNSCPGSPTANCWRPTPWAMAH